MLKHLSRLLPVFLLSLIIYPVPTTAEPVIGQSSVIVLAFPYGARAAGMGETFTGVADDESALFYNPAGLGQAPLTKKWLHYTIDPTDSVPGVKHLASHPEQKDIWAVTENNKLVKYTKGSWTDYAIQNVDSGQTVEDLARIFMPEADKDQISAAAYTIRLRNKVFEKEQKRATKLLVSNGVDQATADSLSLLIATRPTYEHNRTDIYAYLLGSLEDAKAQELAETIANSYEIAPPLWGQFYTMSIPYEIAFNSTVNDIVVDENSRLWVATNDGLWRYDFEWRRYGKEERIKNDTITALFVNDENIVLVASKEGAYTFDKGLITPIATTDNSVDIATLEVTAIMQPSNNETLLATTHGLYQVTPTTVTHIDTATGLVSNSISSLFYDSQGDLWVGGTNGVSHYDGKSWSRYKFEGSTVLSINEEKKNHLWFATDNGAVEYIYNPKKDYTEWKVHHENNNLKSNDVRDIIYHNFDIYIATKAGLSVYKHGEIRASIFFENLLPSLHLDNMWHATVSTVIPIKEYGTIGISVNQLFFGDIPSYNPDGTIGDTSSAFEIAIGLSYGLPIAQFSSVGLTAKYFYSRLEKNVSEVSSIAFDVGIMRHQAFGQNLRFGFSMLNMGPAVAYQEQTDKDPIPFTLRGGVSWRPIDKGATRLTLAMDLDREVIYVDPATGKPASFIVAIGKDLFNDERETASDEFQKIIWHWGTEFTFQDIFSGRVGYMHDAAGERKEINLGVGIKAGRILGDFGIIMALGDNTVRQNQVRFSLIYAQ